MACRKHPAWRALRPRPHRIRCGYTGTHWPPLRIVLFGVGRLRQHIPYGFPTFQSYPPRPLFYFGPSSFLNRSKYDPQNRFFHFFSMWYLGGRNGEPDVLNGSGHFLGYLWAHFWSICAEFFFRHVKKIIEKYFFLKKCYFLALFFESFFFKDILEKSEMCFFGL